MKTLFPFITILLFAMLQGTLTAQNGGMNVGSLNVTTSVTVGTTASSVVLLSELISLPPLTNSDINALGVVEEGSMVYSSDSDVIFVFNGTNWTSMAGTTAPTTATHCTGDHHDIDGNLFHGVWIGTQCWMDENLAVSHYPNGDPIPHVAETSDWSLLENTNTADAYCYYNDPTPSGGYGALYTFAAAIGDNWERDNTDGQGICPDGWHLPTYEEYRTLRTWLNTHGFPGTEGSALKSQSEWGSSGNGYDSYGFDLYPSNYRYSSGNYTVPTHYTRLWGVYNNIIPYMVMFNYVNSEIGSSFATTRDYGYSVRCLRD